MVAKMNERVEEKSVDVEQIAAAIDALIEAKMSDPEFRRQLRTWGEKTPRVAAKLATVVLGSESRFFTPFICEWVVRGRHNPLAVRYAAELLVAVGAADKGQYPSWRRGDEIYYTDHSVYYLKLELD